VCFPTDAPEYAEQRVFPAGHKSYDPEVFKKVSEAWHAVAADTNSLEQWSITRVEREFAPKAQFWLVGGHHRHEVINID
jgi:hypothetical protein